MLAPARIEVKCRRIRYIPARIVGDNGNVIAYFALVRIAFKRIKRIAHCNVRRPRNSGIRAIGVE